MRIVPIASTSLQIQFVCPAGGAVGCWKGIPHPPPLGEPVDVEFTIPAVLRWADVRPASESGFAIEGNRIVIRGRVDAVDGQHVITLDVGGAVILAEFADGPSEDPVGATIELPDTRLEIYPTGI